MLFFVPYEKSPSCGLRRLTAKGQPGHLYSKRKKNPARNTLPAQERWIPKS